MLKMYSAEVLSKFPVVQHFPFGSLFNWERDADATDVPSNVHTSSQPSSHDVSGAGNIGTTASRVRSQNSVKASWSQPSHLHSGGTPVHRADATAGNTKSHMPSLAPTRAPWAHESRGDVAPRRAPTFSTCPVSNSDTRNIPTRAPWLKSADSPSSSQK